MFKIIDLYKALPSGGSLLPTSTNLTFWDSTYGANKSVYDREFARRFSDFLYYDFMNADSESDAIANLKADVLSILTFNEKRYAEMYRIFLVADNDFPFIYNYDMTETTGAQHSETLYGATQDTKGQQINTIGERTDSHNVAPYNSTDAVLESSDVASQQQNTDGQRIDSSLAHTDEYDADEWTLHRQGNIGTQNAANIADDFTSYWTEKYKFMKLIFDDICKQLLMIGD